MPLPATSNVRECSTARDIGGAVGALRSKDSRGLSPIYSGCRSLACVFADLDESTQANRTFPTLSALRSGCPRGPRRAIHVPHLPVEYFSACRAAWPDRTIPECAAPF